MVFVVFQVLENKDGQLAPEALTDPKRTFTALFFQITLSGSFKVAALKHRLDAAHDIDGPHLSFLRLTIFLHMYFTHQCPNLILV